MIEPAEQYEHAGLSVEIVQDEDASSPQDNDNAGTIYSWSGNFDGDERISEPEEELEAEDDTEDRGDGYTTVDLPMYMRRCYDAVLTIPLWYADYGSSGARIYVNDEPNCAICFTQKELDEEFSGSVDDATKYATARIGELDNYLQGNVWGIVIKQYPSACPCCGFAYYWQDVHPGVCDGCGHMMKGEVLESVWGFIGNLWDNGEERKYILEEANSIAEDCAERVEAERQEALRWACADVVTV